MEEREKRSPFGPEQAVKILLEQKPGADACTIYVEATGADATVTGLGLLVIRLARELQVQVETVLAATAVAIMKIGEQVSRTEK